MRWRIVLAFDQRTILFDPRVFAITRPDGCNVTLTAAQSFVLDLLCKHQWLTRDMHAIATNGRPADYESRVLANHVLALRRALGADAIVTARHQGYKLVGQAIQVPVDATSSPRPTVIDVSPEGELVPSDFLGHPDEDATGIRNQRIDVIGYMRATLGWATIVVETGAAGSVRVVFNNETVTEAALAAIRAYLMAGPWTSAAIDDGEAFTSASASEAIALLHDVRRVRYASERLALDNGELDHRTDPLAIAFAAWREAPSFEQIIERLRSNNADAHAIVSAPSLRGPILTYIGRQMEAVYNDKWRTQALGMPVVEQPDREYGMIVQDDYASVMGLSLVGARYSGQPRFERIKAAIAFDGVNARRFVYQRIMLPLVQRDRVSVLSVTKVDRMVAPRANLHS
ncbi:MAG: hypothetical protein JNK11_10385 [Alphaproteobacteria bacterium]|nr:hypothetical protein [Alphaproteobacteria bacterium]